MNIAFVGGGNMATALIGGLLQQGYAAAQLAVVEIDGAARTRLEERYGVATSGELAASVARASAVVLAVKPQQMRAVSDALAPLLSAHLVVSIAAGITTAHLSRWLRGHSRIVRAMPNMPALVLTGISALYAAPQVTPEDRRAAQAILAAVGETLWVAREELMDAVTAVSGSGPAYVFYVMEALMRAAEELGLSRDEARCLTLETFRGAAALARTSPETPAALRARVTSKGGTTERALRKLEQAHVADHLVDAVKQAAERSRELGDELGKL
jgi:pyrroline-5-carboxylate reductase